MRNLLNTIKYIVELTLREEPMTRGDDLYLAQRVLERMNKRTDIEGIRKEWDGNVLETIRRTRQKTQEQFPHLKPSADILKHREENRKDYKEWARGE